MSDEVWIPVLGAPSYEISDDGRVRRRHKSRNWRAKRELSIFRRKPGGYFCVRLRADRPGIFFVHRLVAEVFIGPPPSDSHEIDHINFDKDDNRASNLRWVTHIENMQHSTRAGRRARKLNAVVVRDIRRRHNNGISFVDIASEYGVDPTTVRAVCNRSIWKHVE